MEKGIITGDHRSGGKGKHKLQWRSALRPECRLRVLSTKHRSTAEGKGRASGWEAWRGHLVTINIFSGGQCETWLMKMHQGNTAKAHSL